MGNSVPRAVRRLQAKADLFRMLARHTQSLVERERLMEMAENEDRKIREGQSPHEAWTDLTGVGRVPLRLVIASAI